MKKSISIILIGVLVISGFGAVAFQEKMVTKTINDAFSISAPELKTIGNYLDINFPESTSYLRVAGNPMIPKVTKKYILPFGAEDINVKVDFLDEKIVNINKQIRPSPEPIIDGQESILTEPKSDVIYQSAQIYPETKYNVRTSTGLNGLDHVVFLTVECYPIRYSPANNELFITEDIDIDITYSEPSEPVIFGDSYDLLIITPEEFADDLQPLVDHKNDMGMQTILMTLEDIYEDYNDGRDDAENVKLFIYDALDPAGLNWGISYVLLVGGMIGQNREWYLPVRYTNNHAGAPSETGFLSDLYFADIYKNNGTEFEDWDENGNDIFAEFTPTSKDIVDDTPDVYVGRLAVRNAQQLDIVINKIISYESEPADESWYKNMLLVGGDTYPDSGPAGAYEAEIDTDVSASYMTGFDFIRLWASTGALTGQRDVEKEINNGVGFIHMAGHANPSILVTYPPDDVDKENKITMLRMYSIPPLNAIYALFYQGKGISGFIHELLQSWNPRLRNGEMQPVAVIGGCHNSQFNVTIKNIQTDGFTHAYGYGEHGPKCFSWWLNTKEDGGCIATMGNSGLGMGVPGFDYPTGLDGWLLPRFFYNYGQLGKDHVGEAHSAAIADYVAEFDINMDDADRQMIEQWVLLGDPSLMMGGYE